MVTFAMMVNYHVSVSVTAFVTPVTLNVTRQGSWISFVADEEMIDCNLGGTIAPSNGTVDCTKKNSPGSLCTYRCQDGYSLDGPAKTTCMNAGTWSPNNFPRCISKSEFLNSHPTKCNIFDGANISNSVDECRLDLPDPENGIVTCSQAKEYKSVCRFYCDQGYSLGLDPIYNQVTLSNRTLPNPIHFWTKRIFQGPVWFTKW